jgi:peptidoglycan hydrolase-like protein with peptidoglycan-binding domain
MFNFDFKEMLTTGAKGEAVETLQKALQATGFDPGKADGLFGEKTKAALTQFQQKAGLDADGVFGPKSKEAVQKSSPSRRRRRPVSSSRRSSAR